MMDDLNSREWLRSLFGIEECIRCKMIIWQSQINSCGISVGPCTQRVSTGRFVIASSAVKRKQVWIRK